MLVTLREHLRRYLDSNPTRTIPSVAKKGGLSEMTVRRIVQGESTATFETASAILKICATREESMAILRAEYPEMAAAIDHVWGKNDSYSVGTDVELLNALSTSLGCYIINLAACNGGVTREIIAEEYGSSGIKVLDGLLEKGILVEKKGAVKYIEADFSICNSAVLKSQVRHFIDAYDCDNPGHALTVQVESVSQEGFREVQKVLIEAANKIGEIRQSERFKGGIPFFFCAFLNRLYGVKK